MTPALPRELWEQVVLFLDVPDIVALQGVCQLFKTITSPTGNGLLWKRKASQVLLDFHASPESLDQASALDLRLLPAAISHKLLIRWTLSGPLVFFTNALEFKIFSLTSGMRVKINPDLLALQFSFTVPFSNWMVFKDSFGEYQLGYYNVSINSLDFVDSSEFRDLVTEVLTTSGNGRIIPLRGHEDVVVVGVMSPPTGNVRDGKIQFSAIHLSLSVGKGGELYAKARIHWTQCVPQASALFGDSHDGFLILGLSHGLTEFKVLSIRCGTVVAGGGFAFRTSPTYQSMSQKSTFMTCSRSHLFCTTNNTLNVCRLNGTEIISSFSLSTPTTKNAVASPKRLVISDDGRLVVEIDTKIATRNGSMQYEFAMKMTDISSGVVEMNKLVQSSGDALVSSGVFVVYEDFEFGVWKRHTAFLEI
ncbi:hypothetical protein HDU98_006026 [Podochytrium sp. JEL0797]|nr:hypothetical protein HDU98_006026 [Podochytrium sp. JEL0797]